MLLYSSVRPISSSNSISYKRQEIAIYSFITNKKASNSVLVDKVVTVSCLLAFYIIGYLNSIII